MIWESAKYLTSFFIISLSFFGDFKLKIPSNSLLDVYCCHNPRLLVPFMSFQNHSSHSIKISNMLVDD